MPLPHLELKPGITETYRGGNGFDTILDLFNAVHEGVLEVGPGCSVLTFADPQLELCIGYVLYAPYNPEVEKRWVFSINRANFKASVDALPPRIRSLMQTWMPGSVALSIHLQNGLTVEQIETVLGTDLVLA